MRNNTLMIVFHDDHREHNHPPEIGLGSASLTEKILCSPLDGEEALRLHGDAPEKQRPWDGPFQLSTSADSLRPRLLDGRSSILLQNNLGGPFEFRWGLGFEINLRAITNREIEIARSLGHVGIDGKLNVIGGISTQMVDVTQRDYIVTEVPMILETRPH